uniref:Uncharacterized protein n=1 Tax=Timema shepardi TaxID=629360 RepID=A0A7R9AL19_TIMSH|nr:unnamed protein product [Timema shepardi]
MSGHFTQNVAALTSKESSVCDDNLLIAEGTHEFVSGFFFVTDVLQDFVEHPVLNISLGVPPEHLTLEQRDGDRFCPFLPWKVTSTTSSLLVFSLKYLQWTVSGAHVFQKLAELPAPRCADAADTGSARAFLLVGKLVGDREQLPATSLDVSAEVRYLLGDGLCEPVPDVA